MVTEAHEIEKKIDLSQDPDVKGLVDQVDEKDQLGLLEYGKEPATEISKFSDRILGTIKNNHFENSNSLIKDLNKIMEQFDRKDFEEGQGFLVKIFGRSQKIIEKMFNKYQTMGKEIDKVYVQIAQYEDDLIKNTKMLDQLYQENYQYFIELEKYITAGKLKLAQIKNEVLPTYEAKAAQGDLHASMELETIRNGTELLEQRIYDLEVAKNVALQTAPQIRLLQRGNTKLVAKINSAFVTTIPVFKNGLIQAVSAKRQKLVADSLSELDRRTNEMLVQNAKNITQQSIDIARLSGGPSIKIDTIEEAWNIIMKGLEETKSIEEENKRIRIEGEKRMKELIDHSSHLG